MEFDEYDAIEYMRDAMCDGVDYDDDELLNVIDMIYDYYEANGLLDIDVDSDEPDVDPADIVDYVKRMLAKDKGASVKPSDVSSLVRAYLSYENSLEE